MSDEKFVDNMKQEIRTRMQSLAMPTPKIASEFYTAEEMVKRHSMSFYFQQTFSSLGTIQKTKKGN